LGADIVYLTTVRVIEGGDGADFALEAVRETLGGNFNRDIPTAPVFRLIGISDDMPAPNRRDPDSPGTGHPWWMISLVNAKARGSTHEISSRANFRAAKILTCRSD
jgi:hypothetical protein